MGLRRGMQGPEGCNLCTEKRKRYTAQFNFSSREEEHQSSEGGANVPPGGLRRRSLGRVSCPEAEGPLPPVRRPPAACGQSLRRGARGNRIYSCRERGHGPDQNNRRPESLARERWPFHRNRQEAHEAG